MPLALKTLTRLYVWRVNDIELDPSKLNSLAFLIRPEDTPYDVWIDDLRFVRR